MRWPLLIVIALAVPAIALARPKVAVAPIDGDDDGQLAAVIAEEAKEHAKVTTAKQVGKTMSALGIGDASSAKALKKLRTKLDVDAVIHGSVERDGSKKRLELTVSGRHDKESTFDLKFKSATAKAFKKELRDKLAKHIADAGEGDAAEEDSEDDAEAKPKPVAEDEPKHKHADEDAPRKHTEEDHPAKHVAETDEPTRAHKHSDDDTGHRRHRHDDEEPAARHAVTQAALWLDGGALGARRSLTYDGTGMGAPPPVGTASISGAIEGEVYPGAFSTLQGPAAGLGFYGSFGKALGLSIQIPGSTATTAIDSGYYSAGVRYRFTFGTSSLAVGASYWAQHYLADRSGPGATLDMPDTSYTAVAPGALARFAATPTIGVRLGAEVPLMLSSGPITGKGGFGVADIIAFGAEGGVDVALGTNYGVTFAAVFDQIGLSFKVPARGVSSATDRTMGATASFALIY